MIFINKKDSVFQMEWQNIDFKNFDSHSPYSFRETPQYIQKKDSSVIINAQNKYITQQKIIKLLSNDTLFHYNDGIQQLNNLYPSMKHAYSQLKLDFDREVCSINNYKVESYSEFINYIEYNIHNFTDRKLIISSCTQAIMSIPLLAINQYFDLEQYVIGEVDSEIDDKSMYVDLEISKQDWAIHIQKPLRIFDTYDTLYCVLLDLDIDTNGLVISIRPFL